VIWCGCTISWIILGSTLLARSGEFSGALTQEVHRLWGPPLEQRPPTADYTQETRHKEVTTGFDAGGQPVRSVVETEEQVHTPLPLSHSQLWARLELQHRRKGLLWFPTYTLALRGHYTVENHSGADREVHFRFPIEEQNAGLDGFSVRLIDGT